MTFVIIVIVVDLLLAAVATWKFYHFFKNFKDERPDLRRPPS